MNILLNTIVILLGNEQTCVTLIDLMNVLPFKCGYASQLISLGKIPRDRIVGQRVWAFLNSWYMSPNCPPERLYQFHTQNRRVSVFSPIFTLCPHWVLFLKLFTHLIDKSLVLMAFLWLPVGSPSLLCSSLPLEWEFCSNFHMYHIICS